MNIKTLIPYDEESPLQARVLAADPLIGKYYLYKEAMPDGVDFAQAVAQYVKESPTVDEPTTADEAHVLHNLMAEGKTILIDINKVEQLIPVAAGNEIEN